MRNTKSTENFPYESKQVCYIEVSKDGSVTQIHCTKEEIRASYQRIVNDAATLYAVWPGQYRSDLFIVDDLNVLADAYGIERENSHLHNIEYKISEFDDGKSLYAYVDIVFKCGCKLDFNNIKALANDLNKQYGWIMATSSGFGCSYCPQTNKTVYSIRVRRSSMTNK